MPEQGRKTDPEIPQKIWVAGHRGLVGSALMRRLEGCGGTLLTVDRDNLDLTRQAEVEEWLAAHRPDQIYMAAARVGGIQAHLDQPAEMLRDNLAIAGNVIHAAHRVGVPRLLYIASAAVYPLEAPQPYRVEDLWAGPVDPSHIGYATAKRAGIALCQTYRSQFGRDYISVLPTNLYGTAIGASPRHAHVVPAMLRRFGAAKRSGAAEITLWGTGTPLRDFLHADDLADALVFLMARHSGAAPVNIGSGQEVSIRALAETIAEVVGYDGALHFDTDRPDGASRRLMDLSALHGLGWSGARPLRAGLEEAWSHLQHEVTV